MLPALVFSALLCFALSIGLTLTYALPPAAAWHLVFAAGVMPLIVGAMMHFVPVLTRSGAPRRGLDSLPLLALAAGLLATGAMAFPWFFVAGLATGAPLGLAAAIAMLAWIVGRGRKTLGSPHPGLHWYAAAVGCLALALTAAMLVPLVPEWRWSLRALHLHLNTLGFIGLTALGTLQVLVPTAEGRPDPQAARRLRRDLPIALAGVLAVAAGAAAWRPLAHLGLVLLAWACVRPALAWLRLYGPRVARRDGATPCLFAALLGLVVFLPVAIGHAIGRMAPADAILGFVAAFLLPLVMGAASQLLPVWVRPGPQGSWHARVREQITRYGGVRGFACAGAGIAAALGVRNAVWVCAAMLALFVGQVLSALLREE